MQLKKTKNIKEVISQLYDRYKLNQKIDEIKLINCWEKVTGKMVSNHTKKIMLKNKTLYVYFDNAALKNEMFYRRFALMEALNLELGNKVIEKIFIG